MKYIYSKVALLFVIVFLSAGLFVSPASASSPLDTVNPVTGPICFDFSKDLALSAGGERSLSLGRNVTYLQSFLIFEGFSVSDSERTFFYRNTDPNNATPDEKGVFLNSTLSAVIAFQKKNNLPPTGIVSGATLAKIKQIYTSKYNCKTGFADFQKHGAGEVAVTSPGAGEKLIPGQSYVVKWKTASLPIPSMKVRLYLENRFSSGEGYWKIIADNLPNTGMYVWKVPVVPTDSPNTYQITVYMKTIDGHVVQPLITNDGDSRNYSLFTISTSTSPKPIDTVPKKPAQAGQQGANVLESILKFLNFQ